ncbi:hypothetical protein BS17DRAFT_767689 [Gyrodon lividus]|nr:hypothetical protein BS17DRAFT_767689 [Gyrodon lividus]
MTAWLSLLMRMSALWIPLRMRRDMASFMAMALSHPISLEGPSQLGRRRPILKPVGKAGCKRPIEVHGEAIERGDVPEEAYILAYVLEVVTLGVWETIAETNEVAKHGGIAEEEVIYLIDDEIDSEGVPDVHDGIRDLALQPSS